MGNEEGEVRREPDESPKNLSRSQKRVGKARGLLAAAAAGLTFGTAVAIPTAIHPETSIIQEHKVVIPAVGKDLLKLGLPQNKNLLVTSVVLCN